MTRAMSRRAIFGDFQTPDALACAALRVALPAGAAPASILEPTVGLGSMLAAAITLAPRATAHGLDIDVAHLAAARDRLPSRVTLQQADVFTFDFDALADELREPVWLVGNPPWVTSSAMPELGGHNLPKKLNVASARSTGLDAITGKANFDVAEWILARLATAFAGRDFHAAFLVKTQVARRLVERAVRFDMALHEPRVHRIDAQRAFGASVDACLFTFRGRPPTRVAGTHPRDASIYESLEASAPSSRFGVRDQMIIADLDAYERVGALLGRAPLAFRSGVKHDAADVFELVRTPRGLENGLGELVDIERDLRFPFRKSADLGSLDAPERELVLPQRGLGDDTAALATSAPRAFAYLARHGARLDARRSSVYRGRPRFAVFGIGPYAFAPHKVAVSGLAKRPVFTALGPVDGRPTLLDDTSYFVACPDAETASALVRVLDAGPARSVLAALVYREAKRPLTKDVLMRLDFARLAEAAFERGEVSEDERARVVRIGIDPADASPA